MPWVPKTDFEEELVNLQPNHDFIFGYLSETHHPRPKSHVDYAATRKREEKEQQKEFADSGQINAKLRVIQQIQLITNSKPVGEQPSVDDWDTNDRLEQETIGMIRHCGIEPSVDQPLNENVTIASYPVENTNKVFRVGRKKVALFFDENVFKLKEKVSDTSSFESCNSVSNKIESNTDNSGVSQFADNTSFNTSSSLSFSTNGDDSFSSASTSCFKSPSKKLSGKQFSEYEKLLENTSFLSLDNSRASKGSQNEKSGSYRTADQSFTWTPVFEDDDNDNMLNNKDNWPALSKNEKSCDINTTVNNDLFSETHRDITDDTSSEASGTKPKTEDILKRFIKSVQNDEIPDNNSETATMKYPQEPTTYASITKRPKTPKKKEKIEPDFVTHFPPFYTTRKMYALKRGGK